MKQKVKKHGSENKENLNRKKILTEVLHRLGLINKDFVGKIILNCNQGHISTIERVERIK